jgi:outer membrane receptor protein involved in Fe transport
MTGRAVLDYRVTPDNLIYASYSRGYKSGGINPPLAQGLAAPTAFDPEYVNAFEIGTKNRFGGGALTLNASLFYYQYKGMQLSRTINRTAINDNVDADIYGLEAEAIVRPVRPLSISLGFSYLRTRVVGDLFIQNPRDPAAGRDDAVIIKDISAAYNCVVTPTSAGNGAGARQLVTLFNGALGLAGPTAFPAGSGVDATGAFSLCSNLAATIANPTAPLRALFATPTGALPFAVDNVGLSQNIHGKELPLAPNFKWNVGVQYEIGLGGGVSVVPRADLIYIGDSYGNIFNGPVNRIKGYSQINAQLQVNGPEDGWYLRGWVQNLTNSGAITGFGVGDQSQGLVTNIFTLEPRRYGLTAGVRF